jgi:hypothetical protein
MTIALSSAHPALVTIAMWLAVMAWAVWYSVRRTR